MTVVSPNPIPSGSKTVRKAALRASPVTMPGNAIGKITRKLNGGPPEEAVALHR